MLHCQNCGIPLTAGTMQCPGCGAFISQSSPPSGNQGSYHPPSWDGRVAPGEYSPTSRQGQAPLWDGRAPSRVSNPPLWDGRTAPEESSPASWKSQAPPGGSNPPSWIAPTQAEGGATPYDPSTLPTAGPFSPSSNMQNQPENVQLQTPPYQANASASMPSGSPPPSFPLPSPPPQAMSKRMFLTLIVLAALVILSGVSLIFYTAVARPAQLHANATATMQALTQSTATANVYATGTAHVTATAQAKATGLAKATATAIQSVYANATNGTPAFSSSLAAQDDGNWDVYAAVGGGGCAFTDGALHSTILKKSFYVPCFAKATSFSDFALEAQMTITKGDEGGLIFRANDATSKFYYFRVGRDGYYGLNVSKDDKNSTPLIYDTSPAIKTAAGQPNLLTVIARGKDIYLYINQQFVASTSDGSFSTGEIGVFAGNNGNNTDVAFSNIRVWTL